MAEKRFLVDLNLSGNKAKNFRLEDYATESSTSGNFTGRLIHTTDGTDRIKLYDGSAWKTVAFLDDNPAVSIGLTAPDVFTVTGSPAAYDGTLDFEFNEVAPGTVLAGPGTGSTTAIPTFRSLVNADIPVEIARVDDVNNSLEDYILLTEKGSDLGVATLDENGFVPADQLGLTNYVTLDGNQTITGLKYFTGGLNTENSIVLWSNNNTGTPSANGHGIISVDDTTENLIISASEGMASELGGNVVIAGLGQYLGSVDPDNQIAVIGDIEALDVYDITATQISNWDTAYGWGDHSTEGYLTTAVEGISNTDGNITFSASTGSVTADLATDVEISGDLIVQGDLTVNGDVTTLNTATMNVEDNIFVLNSNVTGTPSVDAGIEVERGTSANALITWDETNDHWKAGTTENVFAIARKAVKTTTGTTHTIGHMLGTSDVTVNCWLDGEQIEANVVITDSNTVTVTTNTSVTDLKTVVVG